MYVSHTTISLNPFSIHMSTWKTGVGLLLILVGSVLISIDTYKEAYREGYKNCLNEIKKYDSKS